MSEKNEFDFSDVESKDVPVKGPDGKDYILCEADGAAVVKFRNTSLACHKYDSEGNLVGVKDLASVEPLLVSLCLFEILPDGTRQPTTVKLISSWKNRVQKTLFNKAMEISDIREQPKERTLLAQVLSADNSPITIEALRDWVEQFADDPYKPLKKWLAETPEEKAKNVPGASLTG